MSGVLQPGLLVLHGNRAELLGQAVFEWIRRHPLKPLEEEIFLVQSNGVAEWLKMALASEAGICAATRVELPARFLWRAYRQVLGREAVPAQSALDKLTLTWRLMGLLPQLAARVGFEPLAGFLQDGEMGRRLQLAERLADLLDQYQVYRSDWLAGWAEGHDVLPRITRDLAPLPLPADQAWQPALWREILAPLTEPERAGARSSVHARFIDALTRGAAPATPIARRVVLFGMTHIPMQTLEALAALSTQCQVLLAVPNPSRYHWADIIEGRELLRMERRRHPWRKNDLSLVSMEDMHAHAHPLLAAWGRQGRDFVRQLDAFDDAAAAQQRFAAPRVDLFDESNGETLLEQVQARIRDLVPMTEHVPVDLPAGDRSIVFHVAHSTQREVEIVHDQLLDLLADPPGGKPLDPRDIVVMVPEIAAFAPAIRSVFGQYSRGDKRFVPFDITDLQERGNNPLLVAVEWLMRLPQQRCRLSEVRDLLDVPAVARHFGLDAADLPRLHAWMAGAGIRWGLDGAQRADLGLDACGEQNTWLFGMRRMLLGYANGGTDAFDGIEPFDEIGGLESALTGSLADLVDALVRWCAVASTPAAPAAWGERLRLLLDDFAEPTDDRERLTIAALHGALGQWLEACDAAGFEQAVSLQVAREAWMSGVDAPTLNRRFRAGGVTFCTLLPMRAVPFEVVCLLGMNDGDYPRNSPRSDFDLMGLPGQRRPGDRSRRDDDRQLMLEAVLSARRVLYVSWTGRSIRDNSEQPPSVLVSQLRDYLKAGWSEGAVVARTTEHPLQPFSRRYFERQDGAPTDADALFTHALEWRSAHAGAAVSEAQAIPLTWQPDPRVPLTVDVLAAFLRNPVKEFFRHRLEVTFAEAQEEAQDDEPFAVKGLDAYDLAKEIVDAVLVKIEPKARSGASAEAVDIGARIDEELSRMERAGRLPMAGMGRLAATELADSLRPMLERWRDARECHRDVSDKAPLHFEHEGLTLVDWLDGLHATPLQPEPKVRIELLPSNLCDKAKPRGPRIDKLVATWVRMLAASACGVVLQSVLIGRDATLTIGALPQERARELLARLFDGWRDGMSAPLPLARATAIAFVVDSARASTVYDGSFNGHAERDEPCLARMYPDYEALTADGRFATLADSLYGPLVEWANEHVQVSLADGNAQADAHADAHAGSSQSGTDVDMPTESVE